MFENRDWVTDTLDVYTLEVTRCNITLYPPLVVSVHNFIPLMLSLFKVKVYISSNMIMFRTALA